MSRRGRTRGRTAAGAASTPANRAAAENPSLVTRPAVRHARLPVAKLGLATAAGAVLPLAFAPFDWFFVAPASYALLFFVWRHETPRRAFGLGLVYGLASFFAGVHWVYISIHEFGELHPVIALGMTGGLVAALGLFPAAAGALAAAARATSGAFAWLGVMPALWVLTEWCRGWIFTGFGWLSAGYSQTESWLMALAPVGGLHAMSWAVMLSAGALTAAVLGRSGERKAGIAVLAVLWAGAFLSADRGWTEPKGDTLGVALVQGAVPQALKWQPEELESIKTLYRELTEQAAGRELIVWPEAALPTLYDYVDGYLDDLEAWADARGSAVMLGILIGTPLEYTNSLISLTDPKQVYTKRHLVPFGEYYPVPAFVKDWMRLRNLPYVDTEPGASDPPPLDVAGERIAVTICYEAVFGAEQLHYLPDATLLVNVSNDAWFGDSIAPHQHLQIARVRAAEAGRYMLRSTNNGITAVIDPRGRVVSRIPQFEAGILRDTVQGFTGATPYARWGNYPIVLGALLVAAAAAFARERGRSKKGSDPYSA